MVMYLYLTFTIGTFLILNTYVCMICINQQLKVLSLVLVNTMICLPFLREVIFTTTYLITNFNKIVLFLHVIKDGRRMKSKLISSRNKLVFCLI